MITIALLFSFPITELIKVIMYNWNNPQYTYYHPPSAPLPVHIPINPNPIPIPNRIVRPPHISFTYKPHVDNSYIEPVNLNANGWQ